MKKIFLIDLDSTITKGEILPNIAKKIGKENEMRELTEACMTQDIPFEEGFRERMKIVQDIPVSSINRTILDIPLNEKLVNFIKDNKENCFIVSGSANILINELMENLGMSDHYYSSKATVHNDKIISIDSVIKKEEIAQFYKNNGKNKVITIGDGSNDAKMAEVADIAIAFGGVRNIAPSLLKVSDYAVYSEDELCDLLNNIIDE